MSAFVKLAMYVAGGTVAFGVLFFSVSSVTNSSTEFPKNIRENQGLLNSDVIEARRNTQQLMAKLQQVAGLDSKNK